MIFFENVHENIKKMIIMCVKTENIRIFVRFLVVYTFSSS